MAKYPPHSGHPRRTRNLRRLSSLTEGLIAPAMRKRGQVLAKIVAAWPDIAKEIHEWCLPADIHFPQNSRMQATLTLSVASGRGPHIQQIAPEICKRINSHCGYSVVNRIRIRQDFMPSRQQQPADQAARHGDKGDSSDRLTLARLEKATATIQSPELRAALIRLGQSLS
jgi:hypothetical protein